MKPSQTPVTTEVLPIDLPNFRAVASAACAGLFATDDFEQTHHVGRAEEVQADHLLGAASRRGDEIQVECRCVGCEYRGRSKHQVELAKDVLFDRQVLVDRLYDEIALGKCGVPRAGRESPHALFDRGRLQAALLLQLLVVSFDPGASGRHSGRRGIDQGGG